MIACPTIVSAAAIVCALASTLASAVERAPSPPPAHPAPTDAATPVHLVSDGTSSFRVVVRSPESPPVEFAAQELAKYVARISDVELTRDEAEGSGPRIVIGLRKDLREADRALLPEPAKGVDGYAIRIAADVAGAPRIVLGGDEPRGVVYGVYDLLERLGCRFAHPALDPNDPETVPRARSLSLPAGAWAVASPMKYRTLAWFEWRNLAKPEKMKTTPEDLAAQIDWAMKSRYNAFETPVVELPPAHPLVAALRPAKQRGMMLQAPGHNFDQFLRDDPKALAEHPEWFGIKKGKRFPHGVYGAQFCWTDPGARKEFTDNVVEFVRQRPDLDILELSGIDGGSYAPACACEQCAKRSSTDNVIALLNGVVERLATEAPRVVVETLGGYQYSAKPPREVKPHPRLRVFWAHWGRPPTTSYAADDYTRRPQLEAWARAFEGRLTAFQYYSDHFANPWLAPPLALQIDGDRRFLMQLGVDGMLNLVYPEGFWWRSSLNGYLAGRSFYDPSVDPLVLLREYATSYYGPAGELIAAYLDEWARTPELSRRSRDGSLQEHRDTLALQRRTYLLPAAALVASQPPYRERVAKTEHLHGLAEAIMDVDVSRREAAAASERGDRRAAGKLLERARARLNKAAELAKSLTDPRQGLVDPEIEVSVFKHKRAVLSGEAQQLEQPAPTAAAP